MIPLDSSGAGDARRSHRRAALATIAFTVLVLWLAPTAAQAAQAAWRVDSMSNTTAAPGSTFEYVIQLTNVGDADSDGSPIQFEIELPAGIEAVSTRAGAPNYHGEFNCSGPGGAPAAGQRALTCPLLDTLPSRGDQRYRQLLLTASVAESATPGVVSSTVTVTGGGAVAVTTEDPTRITAETPVVGVDAFDGQVTADPAGRLYTQAGGHPYAHSTTLDFNTTTSPNPLIGELWPLEPPKNIFVELPPGFVVNPQAAATCEVGELANSVSVSAQPLCPAASQVGTVLIRLSNGWAFASAYGPLPVFNLEPPPGKPAALGFNVAGTMVTFDGTVRSGSDYGLSANFRNVPAALAIAGTTLTLWGVPSDPAHDAERACPGRLNPWLTADPTCKAGTARRAFLRNPTACTPPGVGLPTSLRMDSWTNPGKFVEASFVSHLPPAYPAHHSKWGAEQGPTGCDVVPFDPEFRGAPAGPAPAASPSGFAFDLSIPQSDNPETIGQSDLKKAVVTLPRGVALSASSADGLRGCTPGQIALESDAEPTCPDASRVGKVTVETPLLAEPMTGSVHLATPRDNPFGSLVAIYLVAKGRGVVLKLPGKVALDPKTGQVTTTFDNNPQLPFSNLHVEFDGGPRAPLSMPRACGPKSVTSELTSWSGKTVTTASSFEVSGDGHGSACPPRRFDPSVQAGLADPVAGSSSDFTLRVARGDLDEELKSISTELPKGVLAKLAGVRLCTNSQAAAGTCPASSRIGLVEVGAGAGSNPFFINDGRVFLTEGYKGAPYGLSISVPAVAGPFDLGDVNVRAALRIDPSTAQATVESDPMPRVLEGIPLQVRDVRVTVDRPRFMRSPTNCTEMRVNTTVGSYAGDTAKRSNRFQVTDCAALAFKPRLALRLTGRKQTRTGKHPGVRAKVTQARGEAAIKRAVVELPKALALDPDNARSLCEFTDGTKPDIEKHCPKGSIVGRAKATTPLLDKPLAGNVYFVKNVKRGRNGNAIRTLPMLVVALRGQISINLKGESSTTPDGKLINTFKTVPDAPVKTFNLNIAGGNNGILTITRTTRAKINLCAKPNNHHAKINMNAHNGKRRNTTTQVKTPCTSRKNPKRLRLERRGARG